MTNKSVLVDHIQMVDLSVEYKSLKPEIDQAIENVLNRGDFIQGNEVREFEHCLSTFLNANQAISCANGTDALLLSLMAIGIKPGDEVIVPAFAYISVVEVIALLGAIPVFVDIGDYFFIDENQIENVITENCKAIIVVHLFGQCGNLNRVLEIADKYSLVVIEDAAQALGTVYESKGFKKYLGLFGALGCTSFFPTKNLGCYGDGGAVYTNNYELAENIKLIAMHGQSKKYVHHVVGINSRLDTIQAAILKVKLNYLIQKRNKKLEIVNFYNQQLKDLEEIILPKKNPDCEINWHQFTIKVLNNNRNELKNHLHRHGISSMIYYPIIIPHQEAYKKYASNNLFPNSLEAANNVLSLPIDASLSLEKITYITSVIKDFYV